MGMLLGARIVLTVPLRYKFKPTSPRDADTAVNPFLASDKGFAMQPKSEWHEKAIKWFVEVMNK